jgi:hypothetical protein
LIMLIFFRVASAFISFLIKLFSFGFDVLCTCQFSVKMHARIFHYIFLGYINIAHLHCRTGLTAQGERNMCGLL